MNVNQFSSLGGKTRSKNLTKKSMKAISSMGGNARAKSLTKERRSEIAREAAIARWTIDKKKKKLPK